MDGATADGKPEGLSEGGTLELINDQLFFKGIEITPSDMYKISAIGLVQGGVKIVGRLKPPLPEVDLNDLHDPQSLLQMPIIEPDDEWEAHP